MGTKIGNNLLVQQNIVNGSILDALEQAGINPLDNTKFVNDSILHILDDDKLILALNRASKERRNFDCGIM